jgi:hypothetical protein
MKMNWDDKITSLKNQMNSIKHKKPGAAGSKLSSHRDTSKSKKVVQFALPEI